MFATHFRAAEQSLLPAIPDIGTAGFNKKLAAELEAGGRTLRGVQIVGGLSPSEDSNPERKDLATFATWETNVYNIGRCGSPRATIPEIEKAKREQRLDN